MPEERAWRIAGRLSAIERDGDAEQAALAHLFKHPQDFGRTIYVVLGPSIGKPLEGMENAVKLAVPIPVELKRGMSWSEAKG